MTLFQPTISLDSNEAVSSKGCLHVVYVVAGLLAAAVATITLLRHHFYLSTTYDMGFYVNSISQIARGEWTNSIFGFHVFADHFSPILIPLAPLAHLAPAEGLLIVQALAIGSGVVPAFRLGMAVAGNQIAWMTVAWYSLSASLWHTALYDFRPATLGIVALLWLIAELESSHRMGVVGALAALAASSREDIALFAGLALLLFAYRHRRRDLAFMGAATAGVGFWFNLIGHRLFAPFDYMFWYRYADYGDSPVAALGNLDYLIPTALERLVRPDPLVAMAALLVPMVVVAPLKGWRFAWPGLALMIVNAISANPFVPSIYYQYYLGAVPFLLWGAVHSFRSSTLRERVPIAAVATASIFLVAGPLGLILPGPEGRSVKSIVENSERASIETLVTAIPDDASVSGGTYLLPHLADRPKVFIYPAPFVCSSVLLTWYPETSSPEFVIVEDFDLRLRHLDPEALGYELATERDGVWIWRSTGDHPEPIECLSPDAVREQMFESARRMRS